MIDVDQMLQMEIETSGMTKEVFLFLLERLLGEPRLATVDLGHYTIWIGDRTGGIHLKVLLVLQRHFHENFVREIRLLAGLKPRRPVDIRLDSFVCIHMQAATLQSSKQRQRPMQNHAGRKLSHLAKLRSKGIN